MSATSERPYPPSHRRPAAQASGGSARRVLRPAAIAAAILAGSVALGLAGGLTWAALAPRAVYVVVTSGSADVVNPETTAFIAADAWYCLIAAAGGLVIGLAGYLLAVRRYGPLPMAAILAGSALAGVTARWIGVRQGLGRFDHLLLTSRQGTRLHAPLALAGDSSVSFWPARTCWPAIAFWPLAACAVAGGIVLVLVLRERRAARAAAVFAGSQPQLPFSAGQ